MSELNRNTPPPAHPIESVEITEPRKITLPNNLPVFEISAGSQEVVKIEIAFNAGTAHHSNPIIPSIANAMLQEGTKRRTAREIAAAIDDYGAFLDTDLDKDFSSVTLFTLNRYLADTLPVIQEIITEPVFPEKELEIMRSNRIDKYKINQGKVQYLASKRFNELLFSDSPYGKSFDESSYRNLTRNDLISFWGEFYKPENAVVFLSGRSGSDEIHSLNETLGSTQPLKHSFRKSLIKNQNRENSKGEYFMPKEDALQSAIRIGRTLFNKSHPDYHEMKVLICILGGYFGSRLMSNIREDKGYTYGIGAGLTAYMDEGFFYISTEVGADVCGKALDEIYKEISILQEELVPQDELNLVKNYMLGNLLKSFDGPFERMERFKSTWLYHVESDFFRNYTKAIQHISSERLRELAGKYLQRQDLTELVVGKK